MSGRRTGARLVARLMLVAGLLAAGTTALAGPAAAASPWASVTLGTPSPDGFFNPDVLDFSIPVTIAEGSGVRVRFAVVESQFDEMPPDATLVLTESGDAVFPDLPDDAVVLAVACDAADVCGATEAILTHAVRTPGFGFYLPTSSADDPRLPPPVRAGQEVRARGAVLDGNVIGPQDTLSVTFAVRDPGTTEPIAQGPVSVARLSDNRYDPQYAFTLTAPEGLVDGRRYDLALTATLTGPRFGSMTQTVVREVRADGGVLDLEVTALEDLIYPERDRYLDRSHLTVRTGEPVSMTVQVLDGRGRAVARLALVDEHRDRRFDFVWDGRTRSGAIAAPGRYRYAVLAKDRLGNVDTVLAPVRVAAGRMVARESRVVLRPTSALVDRAVGSCSRLRRVGSGLAFESQVRCTDPGQSVATALFGVQLPRTPAGIAPGYADFRVEVVGRGLPGRRSPYAVLGYITSGSDFVRRVQFDGRAGLHRGAAVADPRSLMWDDDPGGPPFIYWQLGLTEGAHWLAEKFVVTITHRALVGAGRPARAASRSVPAPRKVAARPGGPSVEAVAAR